jgi:hypothetical protein
MNKDLYYLTFCAIHPQFKNYVEIKASTYDSAYELAVARFGMGWRDLVTEKPKRKTEIMKLEAP